MNITHATSCNTKRKDKPNEDFILCDPVNSVFVVLDGVSRGTLNGRYPNPSPAREVAEILGTEIHRRINATLNTNNNILAQIKNAIIESNELVAKYNSARNFSFCAGAVGIIAVIKKNILYYSYIGDCSGRIVRKGEVHCFTVSQTKNINLHKKEYSSYEIRNIICNNPQHPCSYGVLNGDRRAQYFLRSGKLLLNQRDEIILSSDGLEQFLNKKRGKDLGNNTAQDLLKMAISESDTKLDDLSMIKISI